MEAAGKWSEARSRSEVPLIYELGRKSDMGCVWAPSWACIYRGGPYKMPTAVNRFTVAGILIRPPRKILFFRGGCLKMSATVNRFIVVGKSARHGK